MLRWLTTVRRLRTSHLLLLLLATAACSHRVSTTPWMRVLGGKQDDYSSPWSDFREKLKQAGHPVEFYAPNDDELNRAEGYRFPTRILGPWC